MKEGLVFNYQCCCCKNRNKIEVLEKNVYKISSFGQNSAQHD